MVYLSGAGPTVLAITSGAAGDAFTQHGSERMERAIADAMILAGQKHCSKPGNVYITGPVMKGAYVDELIRLFTRRFSLSWQCVKNLLKCSLSSKHKYYFERSE